MLEQSDSESEELDSSSCGEEGKLSMEEEAVITSQKRFFPTELYNRMLPKVLRALEVSTKAKEEEVQDLLVPEGPSVEQVRPLMEFPCQLPFIMC